MVEWIENLFTNIFGDNVILATIVIAMVPVIELRGAIPFAMLKFWGSRALTPFFAFLFSFLGSSLVVPILALIFIPVINWLKNTKFFKNFANSLENRINKKRDKILVDVDEKSKRNAFIKKLLGIFVFVALPLPLTGVWTGTCVAVMLGLGFWWTCLVVIAGNLVAGIIMSTICAVFPNATIYIFLLFLVLVAIVVVYELFKIFSRKKNSNIDETNEVNKIDKKSN